MDSQAEALHATKSATIQFLQSQAASLLLYQSVLSGEAGQTFLELLEALRHGDRDGLNCLQGYGRWFKALAGRNQSWQDYLISQILKAENPFTAQVQHVELSKMPAPLVKAAQSDLRALQQLYLCSSAQLSQWVQVAAKLPIPPIAWPDGSDQPLQTTSNWSWGTAHPVWARFSKLEDWADALADLAAHYQQFGTGLFANQALRWQGGLVSIPCPDRVELSELVGCESQQAALLKNTEFLLAGYPALHVLLYGSRGSGKSSLVKGLLPRYGDRGLRLVEVAKADLKDLRAIAEQLRNAPQKFILFVDDLSFEEDEAAYKSLKVLLEGSLTARAQNVVVYATSNRRHLIREFFGDRPRPSAHEEVHAWDTVQEKLSFSDRFGLTLTFEPADQNTYLEIVRHLAAASGITLSWEDLEYRAIQWATRHNGRSGRTARQFIDFLRADLAIAQKPVMPAGK